MQLLIYVSPLNTLSPSLLHKIDSLREGQQSDHVTSIDALHTYLGRPSGTDFITVVVPSDEAELDLLIAMRHLLRDRRVVLVLPDAKARTVSHGHLLRPRYVSYADGDLSDVTAVISKMLGNHKTGTMQIIH